MNLATKYNKHKSKSQESTVLKAKYIVAECFILTQVHQDAFVGRAPGLAGKLTAFCQTIWNRVHTVKLDKICLENKCCEYHMDRIWWSCHYCHSVVLSNFLFFVPDCTGDGLSNRWFAAAPFPAELLLDVDNLLDEGFFDLTKISSKYTFHTDTIQMSHVCKCDIQICCP